MTAVFLFIRLVEFIVVAALIGFIANIDALTEIGKNGNLVVVPDGSSPLINTSK